MRNIILGVLVCISLAQVHGQRTWEIVHGITARKGLFCVQAIDSGWAYTAGENGIVFTTSDGGLSWRKLDAGSVSSIRGVSFIDRFTGTIVGSYGTIRRTTDGGATWRYQWGGVSSTLMDVCFTDSVHGIIVTLLGGILRTTDGGETWTEANHPASFRPLNRVVVHDKVGYAVGDAGTILKTDDGGASWAYRSAGVGNALFDIRIADSLHAWIVGDSGRIIMTADAGSTWQLIPTGLHERLAAIGFSDSLNGVIVGTASTVLRTTDGGLTWSTDISHPFRDAVRCSFTGGGFGLVAVDSYGKGAIYATTDAGRSWQNRAPDEIWDGSFMSVAAPGPHTVFAAGEGGMMIRSIDHGEHWDRIWTGTSRTIREVKFVDTLSGVLAGDSGLILRTSDGGTSWHRMESWTTRNLRGLDIRTGGRGFIVGDDNTILRSSDGGMNWAPSLCDTADDWRSVVTLDSGRGVAVGENGTIVRTDDGGANWRYVHSTWPLSSVERIDDRWVVAGGHAPPGLNASDVMASSTDGGVTWSDSIDRKYPWSGIRDIAHAHADYGYAIERDFVARIEDSGRVRTPVSMSVSGLNAVTFHGPRSGFIAADGGVVFTLSTAGVIGGSVFWDRNDDSIRTDGEGPLEGWTVRLSGAVTDSATSLPDGSFLIGELPNGGYRLGADAPIYWDQTHPKTQDGYTIPVSSSTPVVTGFDFGFSGPVYRLRIPIEVRDRIPTTSAKLTWGVRPGASHGIWLVYDQSTTVDSLEGEGELPPRIFPQSLGLFDARLSDPGLPLNTESPLFGQGSWTDIREFSSKNQSDTFLVSFLPSVHYGGGYPMTLRWKADRVAESFDGEVRMIWPGGNTTDMKKVDRVEVTDSTIQSVRIAAGGPHLPASWLPAWHLVSLPFTSGRYAVNSVFHSSSSPAFSYTPGIGYDHADSVSPGTGYWVKFREAAEGSLWEANARPADTVHVDKGWNLIPSLSLPMAVAALRTEPAGLLAGDAFGFDHSYFRAVTLVPGGAYWMRASSSGAVILEATDTPGPVQEPSHDPGEGFRSELNEIQIEDSEGATATVYFCNEDELPRGGYELPPSPPGGLPDLRFAGDRYVGVFSGTGRDVLPLRLSATRFPITISWKRSAPSPMAALQIHGTRHDLSSSGSIRILNPSSISESPGGGMFSMELLLGGPDIRPRTFLLSQNYPNPVNPTTRIGYYLPTRSRTLIRLYNILGETVATLVDEIEDPGQRSIEWDATSYPTGVYFYRLDAVSQSSPVTSFSEVRKLAVIR